MMSNTKPIILIADDDPDDRFLVQEAMSETGLKNELFFVKDGQELLDYLNGNGEYTDGKTAPRPSLILLDLNMPRMDGREALALLKADPDLRRIPVVVLTTSNAEDDINRTYDLGVASYITKPVTFDGLIEMIQIFSDYWFNITKLPRS